MTNEYLEVVKRWLAGEEVSQTELEDNALAAWAAYYDTGREDAARFAYFASDAASEAASYSDDDDGVADWIKRYEELTK